MFMHLNQSKKFAIMTVVHFHEGSLGTRLKIGHSSTTSMPLSHLVSCLAAPMAHFSGASLSLFVGQRGDSHPIFRLRCRN